MCKFRGWRNSQASEVNNNINTIKTTNKLDLSFSSPRSAADAEGPLRGVSDAQSIPQTSALDTETVGSAGVVLLVTRVQVRSTPRLGGSSLPTICSFMTEESSLSMSL